MIYRNYKPSKFNIGDEVKVTNPIKGCLGAKNKIGVVTDRIAKNGLYAPKAAVPIINIEIDEETWCVNEDGCELTKKVSISEKTIYDIFDISSVQEWSGKIIVLESGKTFLVIPLNIVSIYTFALLSPEGSFEFIAGNSPIKKRRQHYKNL